MLNKFMAIGVLVLTGCVSEISVPVTGQIGGERAQGQATARLNGEGVFSVMTIDGLQCSGEYDSSDTNPTIPATFNCNDGRTGNVIITRTLNGLSGTVIGKLSDGTLGEFVFGDLTFDQAFGLAGASVQ